MADSSKKCGERVKRRQLPGDPLDEFCENKGCRAMPGIYCKLSFVDLRRGAVAFHKSRIRKAERRTNK